MAEHPQSQSPQSQSPQSPQPQSQPPQQHVPRSFSEVSKLTVTAALHGGIPGAMAMGVQVCSLMWLRTTMNYQYRYGASTLQAMKTLYSQGGIPRFYKGLAPALIQGPLSRFGDTAANTGALFFLESYDSTRQLPTAAKTAVASFFAGCFRIALIPVDAVKTIMQVEGKNGFSALVNKVRVSGVGVLYHGALASAAATMIGHFPWFFTYNTLNARIPKYQELHLKLLRSAGIGFTASVIADSVSNFMRVIKTTKQTSTSAITYPEVVRSIVKKDGLVGLFGRGLKTRILTNGMQGLLFSVLWRVFEDQLFPKPPGAHDDHSHHELPGAAHH